MGKTLAAQAFSEVKNLAFFAIFLMKFKGMPKNFFYKGCPISYKRLVIIFVSAIIDCMENLFNIVTLKKDFLASIIVFLIAMPLAIGISIACGLPVYSGLIAAIIGGIVVGAFSGNSLQVSGPAAGLILIIVDIIQTQGIDKLFFIIFVVGLLQITFGLFSLGKWFRAISPAIIQGMLAGIGISIFLSQFHIMLDSKPQNTFFANIADLFSVIYNSVLPFDGSQHHHAAFIGIMTIGIIVLWNNIPDKRFKLIPSALVAVIAASLMAAFWHFDIHYISLGHNFWSDVKLMNLSDFKYIFDGKILFSALIITFIASAETLLTSNAIDKMCERSKTDYNKEIIAQGIGNSLSGLVGGLPLTGVIVRSAANINAEAQTRLSTMLHGFWILLFVSFYPQLLNCIPQAALAAILVYTGFKLVDIGAAKNLYRLSKGEFLIYMITLVSILFTNLFEGILIGFGAALAKSVFKILRVNIRVEDETNRTVVKLSGNIIFLQLPQLIEVFENLPEDKDIYVCAERLHYIDHACVDFIKDWQEAKGVKDYNVEVDWAKIRRTYPNFKWRNFHKN